MVQFGLASQLDIKGITQHFSLTGRMQIKPFISDSAAWALHNCLANEVVWQTVFNDGTINRDLHPDQITALGDAKYKRLIGHILTQAREKFQYIYEGYPLSDALEKGLNDYPVLGELYDFLNSGPFLSVMRTVTGHADIAFCDAQATAYGPGHFLTAHSDDVNGKNRRAAFVLNLTPGWKSDWGGNLLFLDDADAIVGGFVPTFNALNLFKVPQNHAVSYIPPFGGRRYSITGWLRAR